MHFSIVFLKTNKCENKKAEIKDQPLNRCRSNFAEGKRHRVFVRHFHPNNNLHLSKKIIFNLNNKCFYVSGDFSQITFASSHNSINDQFNNIEYSKYFVEKSVAKFQTWFEIFACTVGTLLLCHKIEVLKTLFLEKISKKNEAVFLVFN